MAEACKRLNMDRISQLPEDVLQTILSRIPIRDAVATSILSLKWRDIWTGIPKLEFDNDFKPNPFDENNVVSTIHEILLLHHGPIVEFTLDMPRVPSYRQIDHVINFISRNGLEDLKLIVPRDHTIQYKLPSSLFSCNTLKRLNLHKCELRIPEEFKGFCRLTSLECDDILVYYQPFNIFIAACPMLRVLSLKNARGIYNLELTSALQLEYLSLENSAHALSLEDVPLLSTLRIAHGRRCLDKIEAIYFVTSLPALEDLELGYEAVKLLAAGNITAEFSYILAHLRSLKLRKISLSMLNEASGVLCLIRNATSLQSFHIQMCNDHSGPNLKRILRLLTAQEFSDFILARLERVEMHSVCDTQPEVEFIRFLFFKSPVLETMVIQTAIESREKQHQLLKKLATFRRASGNAELTFLDSSS